MSSEAIGVQLRIKALPKKAVYMHCCRHNLNLGIVFAFKFPVIRNVLDKVQEVVQIFIKGPKKKNEIVRGSRETESLLLLTKSNFQCMCYSMG